MELKEKQEQMKLRNKQKRAEKPQIEPSILCTNNCGRVARKSSILCSRCTKQELTDQLRDQLPDMPSGLKVDATACNPVSFELGRVRSTEEVMQNGHSSRFTPEVEGDHGASSETSDIITETFNNEVRQEYQEYADVDLSVLQSDDPNENPPLFSGRCSGPTFTRRQVCKIFKLSPNTLGRWERANKVPRAVKLAHNNQYVYTEQNITAIRDYLNREVPLTVQTPSEKKATTLDQAARKSTFRTVKGVERTVATHLSRGKLL